MNFSRKFRGGFETFVCSSGVFEHVNEVCIDSLEKSKVFSYLVSRGDFFPVKQLQPSQLSKLIAPIYWQPSESRTHGSIIEITKAEDIFHQIKTFVQTYRLNGEIYYAAMGMVFDSDKNPLLLVCRHTADSSGTTQGVLCFDYSVLENPEKAMHRFFLRKLIPFILERRKTYSPRKFSYMFANCRNFTVKPTFQGELDEGLVREFLINKLSKEVDLRKASR